MKPAKPLLAKGQTIVFEGDSLTDRRCGPCLDDWAYLRLCNWDGNYGLRVAEWLFCNRPDLRITCHHAAVGGSSCRHLMARLETMVLPVKPDWVVFTLGYNDAAQQIPLPELRRTLGDYCGRLRDAGARCVWLGPISVSAKSPRENRAALGDKRPYFQAIGQVVRTSGGLVLNAGDVLAAKAGELARWNPVHTVCSDGPHTNAIGDQILATAVLEGLGMLRVAGA